MTLRILKYFDQLSESSSSLSTPPESREDDLPRVTAMEICLTAEEIPAQLQTVKFPLFLFVLVSIYVVQAIANWLSSLLDFNQVYRNNSFRVFLAVSGQASLAAEIKVRSTQVSVGHQ